MSLALCKLLTASYTPFNYLSFICIRSMSFEIPHNTERNPFLRFLVFSFEIISTWNTIKCIFQKYSYRKEFIFWKFKGIVLVVLKNYAFHTALNPVSIFEIKLIFSLAPSWSIINSLHYNIDPGLWSMEQ